MCACVCVPVLVLAIGVVFVIECVYNHVKMSVRTGVCVSRLCLCSCLCVALFVSAAKSV